MKTFCDYHPTKPAQWTCSECDVCYCPGCVSKRVIEEYGIKKTQHYCPKCDENVQLVDIGSMIEPFWNNLPKLFAYPLHHRSLILIASISLLTTLLYWIPLIGPIIQVLVFIAVLKYSFSALLSTSQGSFIPPEIDSEIIFEEIGSVFKQIFLFFIIFLIFVFVTYILGIFLGIVFLCFALFSSPAMIILLVTTNDVLEALNPLAFVKMVLKIGRGYMLMYFFLFLLLGAPAALLKFFALFLPVPLLVLVMTMAESFYIILAYHLMGYVLLQYHEEIGYDVDLDNVDLDRLYPVSKGVPVLQPEGGDIGNRVDILIKDGDIDGAIDVIKNKTADGPTDPELAERYFNLLKIKGRFQEMLEHGKSYLDLLAKANQKAKLCQVYLECVSKNPKYTSAPSTMAKIASSLNDAGKPKAALQAYDKFIKANPKNPMVPKAYFLSSTIFNEKLKAPQKAASILKRVIARYPNNEIVPYAKKYLKKMKLY